MQHTLRLLRNALPFRERFFSPTRFRPFSALIAAFLFTLLLGVPRAQGQDVILQAFYWNSHPGDVTNTTDGGILWDSIALVAPEIGSAGFQTVWTPPPTKGFAGRYDMGYGPYDYYDLGEFDSKGTTRTRHGTRGELDAMIAALHGQGVNVMVDAVLNHRAGGDEQAFEETGPDFRFLVFDPPSGRLPSGPEDFHPNTFHNDENPPYHDPIFFEDVCYFNNPTSVPPTNADGTPGQWYFGAPASIGEMGVDLISWARFLRDVGFDELRLDAVKHIEPDYLAKFIIETGTGAQPFALGEFFDFNAGAIGAYHGLVENSGNTGGVKSANLAMFDFPLRGTLQSILNDGSGGQDLFQALGGAGLLWSGTLAAEDVVTWLDTHDTDRTGYVEAPRDGNGNYESCPIPFGNSCLEFETEPDHNPVFQDKEDMGYPVLMASQGRPMVFWKDYFWFGLDDDIRWLMNLRAATATGGSEHIQNLNGFWPTAAPYDFDNNGGNMFAMVRWGTSNGQTDGLVLGLNDHPTKTNAVFVNTPFSNKYLKDYSDGFLFQTTEAFGDGRALVKAGPRDYTWYAPTGLYPQSPDATGSHFSLDATPGGCPHFVALRVGDAPNFLVNGAPIAPGDEVAVKNAGGQVVGIGRIGQSFQWDGTHDMIIEVLGAPASDGLQDGELLRLFVYDASTGQELEAGALSYAAAGTAFSFSPERPNSPNRNGNFASFDVTATAGGAFTCEGIAALTSFSTDACGITSIIVGAQFPCNDADNTYEQTLTIFYVNPGSATTLLVNGQSFPLTGSPQTVTLTGLTSDGLPVDVTADLGNGCSQSLEAAFTAPPACSTPLDCGKISQASSGVYDDGWQSGDNDGTGFGAWNLFTQNNNGNTGGHFVFTSTANGDGDSNGDGDIDSGGEAWGLYANSGDVSNAVRPFSDPLAVGGRFTLQMDNGWIESGGTVGFGLQNASGQNRFELFYRNGASTYEYVDAGGLQAISGLSFTDEGLTIEFELTATDTYVATVTPLDGTTVFTISGTLAFADAGPDIDRVRCFNANAGGGEQRNAYFNNLELCAPLPPCAITAISTGDQSACESATNTYSQNLTVEYSSAPTIGQLVVNGQFFAITGSPQTVELTDLPADGQPVDVTAFFSADPECALTLSGAFTAPAACPPCEILALDVLGQTACEPMTNAYTQQVRVTYSGAPATGELLVNGQAFPVTGSPQTVELTGLDANGQAVDVTASFTAEPGCSLTAMGLFTAPEACPPCTITGITAGQQSGCLPLSNTFTQTLVISYDNAPDNGFLSVNGQLFNITGSPQTVTLAGLASDGQAVDVTVSFTADSDCSTTASGLFTAPAACQAPTFCEGDAADAAAYDLGDGFWQSGDNSGSGFGPWTLATNFGNPNNGGHFVFTSTDNGDQDDFNEDNDIDTGGEAWGLYANSGDLSEAIRPFATPLGTNSQLNLAFDNGFIDDGGTVGFGLQNAAGENLLELFFVGGQATYVVSDGNGATPTGIGFTDEGLSVSITLRAGATYEMRVTQLNGGFAQTFTGELIAAGSGQEPARVRFFNFNAGGGGQRNLYVNSLEICRLFCAVSVTETTPSCPGGATGSFSAEAGSTALPITYGFGGSTTTLMDNTFGATELPAGIYTLTATDANGCVATTEVVITEGDTEDPVITCPAGIQVDNDPGQCAAVVDFAATATDNCGATVTYSLDPGTSFAVGLRTVTATATDAAGNSASCTFTLEVLDAEDPVIACPATPVTAENDPGDCGAILVFAASATDNCGATIGYSQDPGTFFPVGTTLVTATATDAAGNDAECSFQVKVTDTEDPALTCPATPVTVENDPGDCAAIVAFAASAMDNCGVSSLVYSQDPNTSFPVGTTPVTATATDAAGNDVACTFSVTVLDTEAPVPTAELIPEPNGGSRRGRNNQAITDYTVGCAATDNCPGPLTTASVIEVPQLPGATLEFQVKNKRKLIFDLESGLIKVEAPDPQAFWAQIDAAGGVAVSGGQVLTLLPGDTEYVFQFDNNNLLTQVNGPTISLRCTATDAAGNTASDVETIDLSNGPESVPLTQDQAGHPDYRPEPVTLTGFTLYPNPARQQVLLDLAAYAESSVVVEVRNYLGALVSRRVVGAVTTEPLTVDVSDRRYASGVYLVTVIHEGRHYTQRLVIAK